MIVPALLTHVNTLCLMFKAITLMNILIGIVVEVISNVAIAERRQILHKAHTQTIPHIYMIYDIACNCISTSTHMHTRYTPPIIVYIFSHVQTRMRIYIHTHIYIYTVYIYMCVCMCVHIHTVVIDKTSWFYMFLTANQWSQLTLCISGWTCWNYRLRSCMKNGVVRLTTDHFAREMVNVRWVQDVINQFLGWAGLGLGWASWLLILAMENRWK